MDSKLEVFFDEYLTAAKLEKYMSVIIFQADIKDILCMNSNQSKIDFGLNG